jgi:hypothetical protein
MLRGEAPTEGRRGWQANEYEAGMKSLWALTLVLLAGVTARAESGSPVFQEIDFASESADLKAVDLVQVQQQGQARGDWSFAFSQSADYGTSLALPIGLTPSNVLIAPASNVGSANILTLNQANQLGILDNLGIIGAPVTNAPDVGVFEDDWFEQQSSTIQYQRQVGIDGQFTGNYQMYDNRHADVDELDLQSHTANLQFAQLLTERWTSTSYYSYSYYFLSDSSYVNQNRFGTFLTFAQNSRWSWILKTEYNHANFQPAPFLNSDNYSGGLEGTRFFGGSQNNYLKFGYGYGYSDARFRGFAYAVNNVYMQSRFLFGSGLRHELKMTSSFGVYDFYGADPLQAGTFRNDSILSTGMVYGRRLSDNLQLFAGYTWLDSSSNVARQAYNSDGFSVGMNFTR